MVAMAALTVGVVGSKDVLRKAASVATREHVAVHRHKLWFSDVPIRKVFVELVVPGSDLLGLELRAAPEVVKVIGAQLTASLATHAGHGLSSARALGSKILFCCNIRILWKRVFFSQFECCYVVDVNPTNEE